MNNTDCAVPRPPYFDNGWHAANRLMNFLQNGAIRTGNPVNAKFGKTFECLYINLATAKHVQKNELVIPKNGEKPRLSQIIEAPRRKGAAIDQVADGKQAVAGRIETYSFQRGSEHFELAVNIAYNKIPSFGVFTKMTHKMIKTHNNLPLKVLIFSG